MASSRVLGGAASKAGTGSTADIWLPSTATLTREMEG